MISPTDLLPWRIDANSPFYILLDYCRIPIAPAMREEIIACLAEWEEAGRYLSAETLAEVRAAYPALGAEAG
ncbi:MAG: hypothetical protein K5707_07195 [Clostridia bacterium]|nr:hypothetical protein [Clostridia bacterium]